MAHPGTRGFTADFRHNVFEFLAVFAAFNGINVGTDKFDVVFVQRATAVQCDGRVQRGLPTESGQHRIDGMPCSDFSFEDFFNVLRLNGFHIGVVSELRVGHDGGRVGVDQGDA